MRPLALPIAVAAAAIAGCSSADDSEPSEKPESGTVVGSFRVVGGPAPGIDEPVTGTVTFEGTDEHVVETEPDGTFTATMPAGEYTVSGLDGTGYYPASACPPVDVEVSPDKSVTVDVRCIVE